MFLSNTWKIIVDRKYNKKLVKTKLKKSTLRKLICDTCTRTVFSCNNKLYEQTDGVSMGGSLGPVLTNIIIMTEFEQETVNKLINQGLIAFYCRYVDDTLLLIKRNTITTIYTLTSLIKISALLLISSKIAVRTFWTSTLLVMVLASIEKILLLDSTLTLKVLYLGDTKSLGSEH